ncbi:MAG: hypothetical protein IJ655_09045 [Lachnospiraceae bacterium]|nr:hypothetical protein [Lachnospiraceae bacterium]
MIISSQNIRMSSRSEMKVSERYSAESASAGVVNAPQNIGAVSFKDMLSQMDSGINNYDNNGNLTQVGQVVTDKTMGESVPTKIQFETLNYLLRVFLYGVNRARDTQFEQRLSDMGITIFDGNAGGQIGWDITENISTYEYQEEKSYSFATTGTVMTADGRQIDFDVNVGMSEKFYMKAAEHNFNISPKYVDPLVINIDSDVVDVENQTFFFDLDADGKEEELSRLGLGSGFLALDRNADGRINDGSELFGTASGNGFADLSQYDLDGNGWIDEADEIFDKLLIWTPGVDGKDQCYKLKEKGVGAICLQNVPTDYVLRQDDGKVGAAVRRSGMFLMEDGRPGTVQHVDLAM